jgi:hypothetical protein
MLSLPRFAARYRAEVGIPALATKFAATIPLLAA